MLLKELKDFIAAMPGAGETGPVKLALTDAHGATILYDITNAACTSNVHDGLQLHARDPRPATHSSTTAFWPPQPEQLE